jgi:glycerol kinase
MADISAGTWDNDLLDFFGIPRGILPEIGPSRGNRIELDGGKTLSSSLADQTAAFLAVAGIFPDGVLVNLGTGGFVLASAGSSPRRLKGYLTAPAGGAGGNEGTFVIEGTINGIGGGSGEPGTVGTLLSVEDPAPELFCLPDRSGIGSPYWWAKGSRFFSVPADTLSPGERRRAVLEGIIFRVRQIVEDFRGKETGHPVFLAGGLSADPFISAGLAAALKRPLYRLPTAEATLTGAGLLAADIPYPGGDIVVLPEPESEGRYLAAKYSRWKGWADESLGGRGVRE